MPKESNNLRNKKSQSSKPYDVSNSSFVQRATTRVLDLLPQSSWLSRWWAPSDEPGTSSEPDPLNTGQGQNQDAEQEFRSTATRSDLNAVASSVEPVPPKRPKLHVSSAFNRQSCTTQFRTHETGNEELSPITTYSEPSTSRSNPRPFTYLPLPVVPGPHLLDKVNGDDYSESSESTSGCSSLLPQAQSTVNQRMNDLKASGHSRSLVPDSDNMSLSYYRSSGRRPTFNTATFSSPLKNRSGNSPFYSGSTMYGGASGSNPSCITSTRRLGPTVRPVQSKNEQVPLSSTAKKILDALEQFSTPILDAKRIPVTIGTKRKVEAVTSKRYTELNVPTTTDLLKVKRRERLQKSASDARQTSVTSAYSNPQLSSYSKSPVSKTHDVTYKLRETDQPSILKSAGKLRTRWKERQQTSDVREDTVADVRLPNVKLPLKSLPVIDIKISSHSPIVSVPSDASCFSFSAPLQDKSTSSIAVTVPTVNFTFSKPLSDTNKSVKSDNNSNSKSVVNFNFVSGMKVKNEELTKTVKTVTDEVSGNIIKPAAQLETGSVMDSLLSRKNGADKNIVGDKGKNKTPWDSWQCEKCPVKNVNDVSVCASCGAQKIQKALPTKSNTWKCSRCSKDSTSIDKTVCSECGGAQVTKQSVEGFGDRFKKSVGSWECTACLLINKPDSTKCVACETVKAGTDTKKIASPVDSGFGNMFKPAAGSWECKSCLVVNKAELNKCAACETTRNQNNVKDTPSAPATGFGSLFVKPTGSWECESCMLQNASDKNHCAACTTPKPGVKISDTKTPLPSQFSFGIPKGMDDASSGNKFGGFKIVDSNAASTFSFGVNKNKTENNSPGTTKPKAMMVFQFGGSNQLQSSSTETFSFGIPKKDENITPLSNDSGNIKPQLALTEPATDSKCELKNEALKSVVTDSKSMEEKRIMSKIIEPKKTVFLTNSVTDNSNSKTPALFNFESTKTTSIKTADEQNEKTKSLNLNPFLAVESVISSTQICTSLSTPTTVISSSSSNFLKFGTPKTTISSNETKNVVPVSQNIPLSFNSSNESNSGLDVKNIESKPNVFNMNNETKPTTFGGFQSCFTTSASTPFGVSTPSVREHKIGNSNTVNFDTKNSMFASTANKEQSVTHFMTQTTTPNIFGATDTLSTQKVTPNVFGNTETTTSSSVAAFPPFANTSSFPSAVVNPTVSENKSPAVFAFGASNKSTEQSAGFGFTAPVTNNSSNAGLVFNPMSSRNTGFNFAPKVESKVPVFSSNIPSFGSVNNIMSPSVFGAPQQTQPALSFGDTAVSSPVFAFGSGSQTQQPASTVFGFGTPQNSTASGPAASPAFVFGATPTASPVPAFDPNARPTFNFTGGAQPSTFTATPSITPSAAVNPQRKIRKAFRRQPRQN